MIRSTFHESFCNLRQMSEDVLDIVATNLEKLLAITGWSNAELSRRTVGMVSDRSIGLLRSKVHMVGIDKLSAIAEAFGYQAYHLLMKEFDPELLKGGKFDRLYHAYAVADDDGRRVMDTTADYVTQRKDAPNDPNGHPHKKRSGS